MLLVRVSPKRLKKAAAFDWLRKQIIWFPMDRHWPHGVFHHKMRWSRNLQFLCSLWQLRFFLNVNLSTFDTTSPALCCKVLRRFKSTSVPLGKRNFKNCWFVHWSRGLFLWMVQHKSRFWNLKRVDSTTQEFVSGTFRSVNSKAAYWPNTSYR